MLLARDFAIGLSGRALEELVDIKRRKTNVVSKCFFKETSYTTKETKIVAHQSYFDK